MDRLLNIDEIAAYLQLHPNTVRKYINEGRIPGAVSLSTNKSEYRISEKDLESYIESLKVKG